MNLNLSDSMNDLILPQQGEKITVTQSLEILKVHKARWVIPGEVLTGFWVFLVTLGGGSVRWIRKTETGFEIVPATPQVLSSFNKSDHQGIVSIDEPVTDPVDTNTGPVGG